MARRTRRNLRSDRRRLFWARETNWSRFDPPAETQVFGFTPLNLLGRFESDYGADLFGFTITRIRGHVKIQYDATTTQIRNEFSWGIRKSSQRAMDELDSPADRAGITPLSDPHADWMLAQADMGQLSDTSEWKEYRWDVDLKAQRRMDELGEGLYFINGFTGFSSPVDITGIRDVTIDLHILCKRP